MQRSQNLSDHLACYNNFFYKVHVSFSILCLLLYHMINLWYPLTFNVLAQYEAPTGRGVKPPN